MLLAVLLFEGHEEGIVVEPVAALAELVEIDAQGGGGGAGEVIESAVEERGLGGNDLCEIDLGGRVLGVGVEVGGGEQAGVAEALGADEQGIAGEGGEELVGRVAIAGGAEGEDLPEGLRGGVEPVDPSVGGGAEVADAETAGEGSGVEEDAAGAREMHDDYGIRVGGAEFGGFGICGWGDRIWVWRVRFNLLSGFFFNNSPGSFRCFLCLGGLGEVE